MWLEYNNQYEDKLAVSSRYFQKHVTTWAAIQSTISLTGFRTKTCKISPRWTIRTCLQGQGAQHIASCLQLNFVLNVLALSLGSILINFSHSELVGLYKAHRPPFISLLKYNQWCIVFIFNNLHCKSKFAFAITFTADNTIFTQADGNCCIWP